MKGGKQSLKIPASLRRRQLFCILLVAMATMTMAVLTYGFSEKLYKLPFNKALIQTTRLVSTAKLYGNNTKVSYSVNISRFALGNSSQNHNESRKVLKFDSIRNTSPVKSDFVISSLVNKSATTPIVNTEVPTSLVDVLKQTTKLLAQQSQDSPAGRSNTDKLTHDNHRTRLPGRGELVKLSNSTHAKMDTSKTIESHNSNKQNAVAGRSNNTKGHIFATDKSASSVNKPSELGTDSILGTVKRALEEDFKNISDTESEHSSETHIDNQRDNHNQTRTANVSKGTDVPTSVSKPQNDKKIVDKENIKDIGTHIREQTSNTGKPLNSRNKERFSNKNKPNKRKFNPKGFHRYETVNVRQNLMDRVKYGMWTSGSFKKNTAGSRPNSTVRPEACQGCFKTEFQQLIDSPDVCSDQSDIQLLMMIASAPHNREARDVIRKTWGSVCYDKISKIKCVYVFGEHAEKDVNAALLDEHTHHKDMIQYAFRDTYANLTHKTMVSLKWASEKCSKARYVMKTDDDMYVNTELLPLMLQAAPDKRFLGGYCWGPSPPHRDMSSKWYVSFEQFAQPMYPKMCSGTGYVMSHDVVKGVLDVSINIPFFYLEDVYVSLCLKKLAIQPRLLNGFSNMKVEYDPCSYRNQVITSHSISTSELQHMWPRIQKCPKANLSPESVYFPKFFRR